VSLYYYANIIRAMYFAPESPEIKIEINPAARVVLVIGVVGLIIFGIFPEPVLKFAIESAGMFALP